MTSLQSELRSDMMGFGVGVETKKRIWSWIGFVKRRQELQLDWLFENSVGVAVEFELSFFFSRSRSGTWSELSISVCTDYLDRTRALALQ